MLFRHRGTGAVEEREGKSLWGSASALSSASPCRHLGLGIWGILSPVWAGLRS